MVLRFLRPFANDAHMAMDGFLHIFYHESLILSRRISFHLFRGAVLPNDRAQLTVLNNFEGGLTAEKAWGRGAKP